MRESCSDGLGEVEHGAGVNESINPSEMGREGGEIREGAA